MSYKIKDVVQKPRAEWKRTPGAHEAIIDAQDFDLAQRIMRLDTRTTPGGDKVHLFSGVLICGCCGARMTRKSVPYKGKSYYYYYCPTGKKRGCEHAAMLKENDLSGCILDSVKAHIRNVASLDAVIANSDGQRAAQTLARRIQEQIAENERQIEQIKRYRAALYQNMVDGVIDQKDHKLFRGQYAADEARLQDAIAALEDELEEALAGKAERLCWMEHFKQLEDLNKLDRRAVITLVQSIRVVSKTGLDITFSYQAEYEQALKLAAKMSADGRDRAREVA